MKILVAAAFISGSNFAYAINTVKHAEAFAQLGHSVTLACRAQEVGALPPETLARQYAIKYPFQWLQFPSVRKERVLDQHWDFALQLVPVLLRFRPHFVYSRSYIAPWLTSFFVPTVAESHAHPGTDSNSFRRFVRGTVHRQFLALTTISPVLGDAFKMIGVPKDKILILPDAVDLHVFMPPESLPPSPYTGRFNVVYSGHLYDYKGIPTIIAAAEFMPEATFHLVGGLEEDVARVCSFIASKRLNNVVLHGHKDRVDLPPYLWHADVLLLPPSKTHPSAKWTSPVKMGEYLASGCPLISSDIPALRHWLNDGETLFVAPDDGAALAAGIRWVMDHKYEAQQMAMRGQKLAQSLSYSQRAQQIMQFCGI